MVFQKAAGVALLIGFFLLVLPCSTGAESTKVEPAPVEALADSAGLDLTAYRGQVVYLDFWASWCAPCKKSFPWMREMHEIYGKQGLTVVTVNLDRDPAAAKAFLAKNPAPFRVVYDPKGNLAKAHQVLAMPSSFLYDRAGRQRAAHQGFKESEGPALKAQILELLAEPAPDSLAR